MAHQKFETTGELARAIAQALPKSFDEDRIKINDQPGDIITCAIDGVTPHIMIVSDRKGISGHWALIHNVGIGVIENDVFYLNSRSREDTRPGLRHCIEKLGLTKCHSCLDPFTQA